MRKVGKAKQKGEGGKEKGGEKEENGTEREKKKRRKGFSASL